ncbi:MAG: methyltransferase type 11, partial [Chitinivorax sp.]
MLHYIPHAEQDQLLDRIRAALGPGGLFLTRVGDASGGWRFRISQWVDRRMAQLQGHRYAPTWCRP